MSSKTQPECNPSGHDRSTEYQPADAIYVTEQAPCAAGVFHATADCWALQRAPGVLEKPYRNRPIRSEPCAFCHDDGDGA